MTEKKLNFNTSAEEIARQRDNMLSSNNNQQKKKVVYDAKNYLSLRLNEGEKQKKITIRILPVSSEDSNVFLVLHTHSLKVPTEVSASGYKSVICLNDEKLETHDERGCPICNKVNALLKESNDLPNDEAHKEQRKALIKQAMSYKVKDTFIVRVIERGHEDEGVKFWRFNRYIDGTGIHDQLMAIFDNRAQESIDTGDAFYEITGVDSEGKKIYKKVSSEVYKSLPEENKAIIPYNVFDLNNGKDFIITLQYVPSTKKTTMTISDAGKESPLSDDIDKALSWINDKKQWKDLYASKSYDYLELVVDGKIPVYDKDAKKWVEKKDNTLDKNIEEEAQKILKQDSINVVIEEDSDDVPF